MIILDVPPMVAYLLISLQQTRRLNNIHVIDRRDMYPITGVSLMSTQTAAMQHELSKILLYPGIIKLRSIRHTSQGLECIPTNGNDAVAMIYDPNVVLTHLKYNHSRYHKRSSANDFHIKVTCNYMHNLSTTRGKIGGRTIELAWLPAIIPPFSYTITREKNSLIIMTNVLDFDIVSCMKLAHIIHSQIGPGKL